jgi:tRNA (guanine37-N1)-methyltransferase
MADSAMTDSRDHTLRVDILTLFPGMLDGFVRESMLGRAVKRGLIDVRMHNLRDWTHDKHRTTDDRPFGGGAGMLMKPEPIFEAVESLRTDNCKVIYLAPDGVPLKTSVAQRLAAQRHLILLSGHYEGVDQRVRDHLVDEEISIGDYVLTNGTLAAAVLTDCIVRHIPGVLGDENSLTQDSFSDNLLTFPQYTRPETYRGWSVPSVLLSGNHEEIAVWRQKQREARTRMLRPDLIEFQQQDKNESDDR